MCNLDNLDNADCRAEFKADASYWILGVAGISVAIVGLGLNMFGLFVATRSKEKHIFQKLIVCLLTFDTILLFFSIIDFIYRGLKYRNPFLVYAFSYIVYPAFYVCLFCSIYMTVCISHERYSALQDPIRYSQEILKHEGYQKRRIRQYVFFVIVCSFLYNIFRFFEYKVMCMKSTFYEKAILDEDGTILSFSYMKAFLLNCTPSKSSIEYVVVQMNDENVFDMDQDIGTFKTIIAIADSVVLGIIPVLLLISLNSRIHSCIQCVKKDILKDIEQDKDRTTSNQPLLKDEGVEIRKKISKDERNRIRKDEIKMALSFITIVAAFLCCYSVKLLFSLISASNYKSFYEDSKPWYIIMEYLGLLLIVVNSTINILLYGLWGKQFRKEAYQVMTQLLTCKFEKESKNQIEFKLELISKESDSKHASSQSNYQEKEQNDDADDNFVIKT